MTVAQVLREKGSRVHTIDVDESAQAAAERLDRERIGALVVMSGADQVAGIISERDLVRGVAREGAAALQRKVADLMTREVVFTAPGDTLEHVMGMMTERRIRHLPVQKNDRLVGIVSIGDVVKLRIAKTEMEAAELRRYIAGV
jgi:CBS domain-containing protein